MNILGIIFPVILLLLYFSHYSSYVSNIILFVLLIINKNFSFTLWGPLILYLSLKAFYIIYKPDIMKFENKSNNNLLPIEIETIIMSVKMLLLYLCMINFRKMPYYTILLTPDLIYVLSNYFFITLWMRIQREK